LGRVDETTVGRLRGDGVRIEIEVTEHEPPSGMVRTADGSLVAFDGWLGLMRVLSDAIGPSGARTGD
jgi:hypothetical protein